MTIVVTDGPSVTIDESHGSPFDRGNADFWYYRQPEPHYWPEGTYHGVKVTEDQMSDVEIAAYNAGYAEAYEQGDQKDYT